MRKDEIMKKNLFDECEIALENELVIARRRYVSESTVAVEMRLQPGGLIPEHSTPEAVFFYILEGSGTLTIGGESADVYTGMVASCPAEVNKSISNNSEDVLKVLVVKMG